MKTFVFASAFWVVALLPHIGCQTTSRPVEYSCTDQRMREECLRQCSFDFGEETDCETIISNYKLLVTPRTGEKSTTELVQATPTQSSDGEKATSDSKAESDGTGADNSASGDDGKISDTSEVPSELPTPSAASGNEVFESTSGEPNKRKKGKAPVGAIAGGVVGGVLFLAIVGGLIFFFVRRHKKNSDVHHEAVTVLEKSRASSPTSHASPIYGAPAPSSAAPTRQTTYEDSLSAQPQPQFAPSAPVPPPPPPVLEPAELHSREVDEDGVSVSSFDMQRTEERSVPRLPVYRRDTPPGGSSAAL